MSYAALAYDAVSLGLGALSTLALFASFPAVARQTAEVRVGDGDLDLIDDTGRVTLNQRVRGAVKGVCRPVRRSSTGLRERNAGHRAAFKGTRSQVRIGVAKAGERNALASSLAPAGPRAGLR